MSFELQAVIFSAIAIVLTLISGYLPLLSHWKDDHLHGFVSFSAGVLIATAFLHILPEAIQKGSPSEIGGCILFSFLFLFILEKFIMLHPCEETHCDYHTMGLTAFVGMTIHTFFDGFALGASILIPGLGTVVFFAIMAHKIPASFSLASILKKASWSSKKIMLFMFLFSLVIPLGTFAAVEFLHNLDPKFIGRALALSLGTFIYISTSDFLPEVHRAHSRRFKNLSFFLCGIILMWGIFYFLPE